MGYYRIKEFVDLLPNQTFKNFIIFPPYLAIFNLLASANNKINVDNIGLQHISAQTTINNTGLVSFLDANELGIKYALINHPELVDNFVDEQSFKIKNNKINVLLKHGFKPVVCVGLNIDEIIYNDYEEWAKLVLNELKKLFDNIKLLEDSEVNLVYCPNFFIRNNILSSTQEILDVMDNFAKVVQKYFGEYIAANKINLYYGGKINNTNVNVKNKYGLFLNNGQNVRFVAELLLEDFVKQDLKNTTKTTTAKTTTKTKK